MEKYGELPIITPSCEDFNPLSCWLDAGYPSLDAHGKVAAQLNSFFLYALARLYNRIDSTSCQALTHNLLPSTQNGSRAPWEEKL